MLSEKVVTNKLTRYFNEHYGKYDETAEWHADDQYNRWTCDIWQIGKTITMVCDLETGMITESQREYKPKPVRQFNPEDIVVKNIWKEGHPYG